MSKLTRWAPFTPLHTRHPFFREFFDEPTNGTPTWNPQVDVRETPEAYFVQAEVPGLDPAEIEITLKDKTLTVKGEKARAETREEDQLHVFERTYGAFQRVFTFRDPVDAESVTAESNNGLLTIQVNKVAEAKPRRIQITPAE